MTITRLTPTQTALVAELLNETDLMDMVELWANQRGDTCQRQCSARIIGFDDTDQCLVVDTVWHVWEDAEVTDVFFEHRATTTRTVSVPIPASASSAMRPVVAHDGHTTNDDTDTDNAWLRLLLLHMIELVVASRKDIDLL
jgi:hypothetical protein